MNISWQFISGPGTLSYALFDWIRAQLNSALVNYLLDRANFHDRGRVLEAGSGPASGSSVFAREPSVRLSVALDIDMDALREAQKRDPGVSLVVADLYHLPFPAGVFDLSWNNSTLEHLSDADAAVAEMVRVTREGGHIFLGVPYRYGPLGFQPLIRGTKVGRWVGSVFDRKHLTDLCRRRGLTIDDSVIYFCRFFIGLLARKPSGLV